MTVPIREKIWLVAAESSRKMPIFAVPPLVYESSHARRQSPETGSEAPPESGTIWREPLRREPLRIG